MKSRMLMVDESLRILPEHDNKDFPFSVYEQPVGRKGYGNVTHWHSEAQFSLVIKGNVIFHTGQREYCVGEGEGIFINCNHIHEALSADENSDSVYLCMKFVPDLILGQANSRIYYRYVEPILYSQQLQAIPLQGEKWKTEICGMLREIAETYDGQTSGYELKITMKLMEIWLLLYENVSPSLEETAGMSYSDRQRSEMLHNFIHENYNEKISLDDIANAAHVSRGECCRLFKRLHRTTPFQYLIQFRLSKSIRLLTETDYSISQIAQQVGFGSSSYYTECFKKELHCTPHKYRQRRHVPFT